MQTADRRVLIDTNVLIYSTLRDDPRFARSQELLRTPLPEARYVSVQNLSEMYPNLTGPKMVYPDDPSVARAKISSIAALPTIQVLPLTADVQSIAMEICEKYGITRQRYYDAQLVATMVTHGISTLLTENAKDFAGMTEITAVDPFATLEAKDT